MSGGEIEITGLMLLGAFILFGWAAWLAHGDH
jgi:hypothetical protein